MHIFLIKGIKSKAFWPSAVPDSLKKIRMNLVRTCCFFGSLGLGLVIKRKCPPRVKNKCQTVRWHEAKKKIVMGDLLLQQHQLAYVGYFKARVAPVVITNFLQAVVEYAAWQSNLSDG